MKRRFVNKLLSVSLAIAVAFPPMNVPAAVNEETDIISEESVDDLLDCEEADVQLLNDSEACEKVLPDDFAERGVLVLDADESAVKVVSDASKSSVKPMYSDGEAVDWKQYSSYYIYSKLDAAKRALWDELEAECIELINGGGKIVVIGQGRYSVDGVKISGYTPQELLEFASLFKICNPQYYFLDGNDTVLNRTTLYLGVYKNFSEPAQRVRATKDFITNVSVMENQLEVLESDYDKVLMAEKLINERVAYDYDFIYNDPEHKQPKSSAEMDAYEMTHYTQSAFSVFRSDSPEGSNKTVCAGYAYAMSLLCNASSVTMVPTVSENHAWDKTLLSGYWYNVDATWDDRDAGDMYFNYFLRSDECYRNKSEKSAKSHTALDYMMTYLPDCIADSNGEEFRILPGAIEPATRKMPAPVISYGDVGTQGIEVSISCGERDAEIFYSVDGSMPIPGRSKCVCYAGTFKCDDSSKPVKAVAIKNGFLPSDDSSSKSPEEVKKYTITYTPALPKGSKNPSSYIGTMEEPIVLEGLEKEGYVFLGWYESPNFSPELVPVTKIYGSDAKDYSLYGLFAPSDWFYSVKFKPNCKKYSGKMSNFDNLRFGASYKLDKNKFKRAGYTFAGWNTKADGSGRSIKNGESISNLGKGNNSVTTLYATWKRISYKIKFNRNGGKKASMKTLSAAYDKSVKLPKNKFKRTGYKFVGWCLNKKGKGKIYKNKAKVKNLTTKKGKTVTLYAIWKKKR